MNQQERAQIKDLVGAEISPMAGDVKALLAKVSAIHEQTIKTNGRVNKIEDVTVPFLHERISESKKSTSDLRDSLALLRWLSIKPYRLVSAIVLVVVLFENKEVLNIVKFFN